MFSVVVVGKNGQLGSEIVERNIKDIKIIGLGHGVDNDQVDITNKDNLLEVMQELRPNVLVNCAAYNKVDEAERYPHVAMNLNAIAVKNLADVCQIFGTTLIHISTNYVFGTGNSHYPLSAFISPVPCNVYGMSKLCGELFLSYAKVKSFIVRTSALYGHGVSSNHNFVKKVLNNAVLGRAFEAPSDQIFAPTYAKDLADYLCLLLKYLDCHDPRLGYDVTRASLDFRDKNVIKLHFANRGAVSWHTFAKKILDSAGFDPSLAVEIKTDEKFLSTRAQRPLYSVLSPDKIDVRAWDEALLDYLKDDRTIQYINKLKGDNGVSIDKEAKSGNHN